MKSLIEIIDQCGDARLLASSYHNETLEYHDSDGVCVADVFEHGYRACFDKLGPALKIALLHIEEEAGPNTSAHAKIRALMEAK